MECGMFIVPVCVPLPGHPVHYCLICEGIVHTVRRVVEEKPDKFVLQTDLQNAFNIVSREKVLEKTAQHFPDIFNWVKASYGTVTELVFGGNTLESTTGLAQGDPIAPLLFSLVLQDIVEQIEEEVPGLEVNAWFLDDGVQVGTAEQLAQVMDIMKREGPSRGLVLNTLDNTLIQSKCKTTVWRRDFSERKEELDIDCLDCGARMVTEEGIILLGAPVGSEEFVRSSSVTRIEKMEEIAEKLVFLEDAQSEYVLLRSCLSTQKMMFALRTVDPQMCEDLWARVDDVTRQALQRLLGAMPSDMQWKQSQLPAVHGGPGAQERSAALLRGLCRILHRSRAYPQRVEEQGARQPTQPPA